ncbi:MAG TPA: dienelactone hydrolase family protein [Terriglobales bacterium]|nr:dienelactone hydrolase family protein [Terriglobales bacterium]
MANRALSEVRIKAGLVELEGELALPDLPLGIVVFAHGSGSSRHSPRNRYVARALQEGRLGTLLMDLLTPAEDQIDSRTAELRFNIDLLSERVIAAVDWVRSQPALQSLDIGLFGASTGAAAALMAASLRPAEASVVVSRGGRPDLAGAALGQVRAATLLIVGGNDLPVLEFNRAALQELQGKKQLEIVPRASHLFEEPGALEEVSRLAREWFQTHLRGRNVDVA